jgi:uncharacterized protein
MSNKLSTMSISFLACTTRGWVVLLGLCFIVPSFLRAQCTNALLWEVSGNGLTCPSYLFGTIHLQDKRAFNFNPAVLQKIQESDAFVMEVEPTTDSKRAVVQSIYLREGQTIENLYSKADYAHFRTIIFDQLGTDITRINNIKPIVLLQMVSSQFDHKDMNNIVDDSLYHAATKHKKPIHSLETIEDQLCLLDLIPAQSVLEYLKSMQAGKTSMEDFIKAYQSEDISKILELTEKDAYMEPLLYRFLQDRNLKMSNKLQELMKQKSVFTAIGAAHLAGKTGILKLLEYQGYTVRPVRCGTTEAEKQRSDWKKLSPNQENFSVLIPETPPPFVRNTNSEFGVLKMTVYMHEPSAGTDDNLIYGLMYTDYDSVLVHSKDISSADMFFTNSRDNVIRNVKGTLLSEKTLKLGEYLGKEYLVEIQGGKHVIKVHTYLVRNRLYVLQVISAITKQDNNNMGRFLQSFQVQ